MSVREISHLQASNETILNEFLYRENRLDQLRSAIYLSGTYVRDYLLESDFTLAEQSRLALADTRRQIQTLTVNPGALPDESARYIYDHLKEETRDYWRALDPVLNWSATQRHLQGYRFLRDEVLPRRSSMLSIADTIASMNQQQLVERDHRMVRMFEGFRYESVAVVVAMFLCGLALAFAAGLHILRLEGQTMDHLKEVTDAKHELRSLSARLMEIQENERKRISRELHDAVGQVMAGIQFELHGLAVALADSPAPLRGRVDRVRGLVENAVAMVRNMALLLRPSMLDDLGLVAALNWQANEISRSTGVRIEITDALPAELPEEHKVCIFRVVQEALTNVCRHARASSVEISVAGRDREVEVIIRDDGRGFRVPSPGGLGLLGIEERVESLGGTFTICSEPGKGTTIQAQLPLPAPVAPIPRAEDGHLDLPDHAIVTETAAPSTGEQA
jgi:signal transduction histidine kinase